VASGAVVELRAAATDFPGEVTYLWRQTGGQPLGLGSIPSLGAAFRAPVSFTQTQVTFEVVATSGEWRATDNVTVTVQPIEVTDRIDYQKGSQAQAGLVAFGILGPLPEAANVTWDFGDGTTSTEVAPLHLYSRSGTYHVTLTYEVDGQTRTYEEDVQVAVRQRVTNDSANEDSPIMFWVLVGVLGLMLAAGTVWGVRASMATRAQRRSEGRAESAPAVPELGVGATAPADMEPALGPDLDDRQP